MDITLVLETYYPTAKWSGSASTYATLIWKDTIIPKPTELDLLNKWTKLELELAISDKLIELSLAAGNVISAGFSSNALGTTYYYDGTPEDQLNLVGAVAAGAAMPFSVRINNTDIMKTYMIHTIAQLKQVMNDGKMFKLGILQKFNNLKDSVLICTSLAEVKAIVWV